MVKKQNKADLESASQHAILQLAGTLLNDLRTMIDQARGRVAHQVNPQLVMLNWHMGKRVSAEILKVGKPA